MKSELSKGQFEKGNMPVCQYASVPMKNNIGNN